jgi:hypothetical protein
MTSNADPFREEILDAMDRHAQQRDAGQMLDVLLMAVTAQVVSEQFLEEDVVERLKNMISVARLALAKGGDA